MRVLGRIMKSGLNGLFATADDPRQVTVDPFLHYEELLAKVVRARLPLEQMAEELASKRDRQVEEAAEFEQNARRALEVEREDVARHFLGRWQLSTASAAETDSQLESLRRDVSRLQLIEQRLLSTIDSLQARQHSLSARHVAATAQISVGELLLGVDSETFGAGPLLERFESESLDLQARADAIDRLIRDEQDAFATSQPVASADAIDHLLQRLKNDLGRQQFERKVETP